ncbi:tyrosine-type recombinase/integrase [Vibrio metschnikovii]|uniref:tyrosine-type recombinase/integrase n=1 Tax=Vibrio metschnikovii TaxID=28172 RepID=UPI001C2F6D81|nr:tyrosine-type recombinase/integrase [Vibrio metschnikovii]
MAQPITCMKQWKQILNSMDRINPLISMMIEFESRTGLRYADASQLKFSDVMKNGKPRDSFDLVQTKPYKMRVNRIEKEEEIRFRELDLLAGSLDESELVKRRAKLIASMKKKRAEAKQKSKVTVGVSEGLKDLIMQLYDYNGDHALIFQSRHHHAAPNKAISRSYINRALKRVGAEVGVNFDLSSHSMRKTFATLLMNNRANSKTISKLLGHSSVAITDAYLHSCKNDEIEAAISLSFDAGEDE